MTLLYPGLHAQSLAASEPDGLLELEGQPVHAVAAPVSALNVPLGQSTQVQSTQVLELSSATAQDSPAKPASHTHTP